MSTLDSNQVNWKCEVCGLHNKYARDTCQACFTHIPLRVSQLYQERYGEIRKLLVDGYIRNIETVYRTLDIPIEIIDIIYLYQKLYDSWSKKYSHTSAIIDDVTNVITFNSGKPCTAYGCHVVDTGIFKWKIKILSRCDEDKRCHHYPYIGIIKDDNEVLQTFADDPDWESEGYQFCGGSGQFYGMNLYGHVGYSYVPFDNLRWKEPGDVLEIILNLHQKRLDVVVNETDIDVLCDIVEKGKYRLALGCNAIKTQFELL